MASKLSVIKQWLSGQKDLTIHSFREELSGVDQWIAGLGQTIFVSLYPSDGPKSIFEARTLLRSIAKALARLEPSGKGRLERIDQFRIRIQPIEFVEYIGEEVSERTLTIFDDFKGEVAVVSPKVTRSGRRHFVRRIIIRVLPSEEIARRHERNWEEELWVNE